MLLCLSRMTQYAALAAIRGANGRSKLLLRRRKKHLRILALYCKSLGRIVESLGIIPPKDVHFIVHMPVRGPQQRRRGKTEESRWDAENFAIWAKCPWAANERVVLYLIPPGKWLLSDTRWAIMTAVRFDAFWLCDCEKVRWWIWKWNLLLRRRAGCGSEWLREFWVFLGFFCIGSSRTSKTPRRLLLRPPRESPDCPLTWSKQAKNQNWAVLWMPSVKLFFPHSLSYFFGPVLYKHRSCSIFRLAPCPDEQHQPMCQVNLAACERRAASPAVDGCENSLLASNCAFIISHSEGQTIK